MTKEIIERLAKWREERGLTFENQREGLEKNLEEEARELKEAVGVFDFEGNNEGAIDSLCDMYILLTNAGVEYCVFHFEGEDQIVRKTDILEQLQAMGYDPEKCLLETIKEIESRTGSWCEKSKKWIKDTSEEAKAKWHKADYSKCKLG